MNLLGKIQPLETLQKFSNELRVTEKTPPAFLVHAGDDPAVPVANSLSYYEALLKQKIYSNMIICRIRIYHNSIRIIRSR